MTQNWRGLLGPYGIWRSVSMVTPELAAEIERLGYGALWLGGSPRADLKVVDKLLAATSELVVATGIVNIWQSDAHEVATSFKRINASHPERFLLGVGTGHREATQEYAKPYETIAKYTHTLLEDGVPAESLVLAALGPKMLRLAAERTAGAHPYLVTPRYVEQARETMGAGPLLAVEHKVVLETDAHEARQIGRPRVQRPYLGLENYLNNLRRLGWTDDDFADGGSDALVDALVAHGSPEQVAAQLGEFIDAGADHVCIQLVTPGPDDNPVRGYRALAAALDLG
ncbi:MAG TPA: LLM class F420-dependent oxidoreductase [Streptosporangiaceae bacterium]|jgi:probable F420-dependent oxidoreductase|nr:LLM class F420-dependent oxidoreductase [Streptosporangiaceae bacterium]